MKHDPNTTANASAVTIAIIYVLCTLFVVLIPDLSMSITKSWFHGIDISLISSWNLSFGSFVLGLVSATVSAWLVGFLFASTYNYFLSMKRK